MAIRTWCCTEMQWFRMYRDLVNCQKVQRLPAQLFRAWVNILCLTEHKTGALPPIAEIAFRLRCPEKTVAQWVEALSDGGLIDVDDDGRLYPHNWGRRQFTSDDSAERVRKHRMKRQQEQPCNVTGTVTVNDFPSVSVSGSGLNPEKRARESIVQDMTGRFAEFSEGWQRVANPGYALQAWMSCVRSTDDEASAFAARERYLASADVARGVFTDLAKWLFDQRAAKWAGQWPRPAADAGGGTKYRKED